MAIEVDRKKIERKEEAKRIEAEFPRWLAKELNKKECTSRYTYEDPPSARINKELLPSWGFAGLAIIALVGTLIVAIFFAIIFMGVSENQVPEGVVPVLLDELFPFGLVMCGLGWWLFALLSNLGARVATIFSFTGDIKIDAENMEYLESIREVLSGSKWEKYDIKLTLE